MWSRYLRTKERDGIVAVFHELHPNPAYCSQEQWQKAKTGITDGFETFISDLRRQKLLIDSPKDDDEEFLETVSTLEHKLNQPTILYLMTARGCNFNCGYCQVPEIARKYGESKLSRTDAFAGIDLWLEHLRDAYDPNHEYFVIFYGGEPLLNKQVIWQSLEYLESKRSSGELPARVNLMIATNGALVDEETVAKCKKYGVMVAVGLDGPENVNDILKVDTEGRGTFERIVAAIKLLVVGGVRTFVSASITPSNINEISRYAEFFKELGVEKFGFNFLKGRLLLKLVGENGLEDYYRRAAQGVIKLARTKSGSAFEYQMEKKQNAFDRGEFFPVDCTCYGNQLVIQPDGQISNCPFYKAELGQVRSVGKDFRIWNQPIIQEWRKRLSLFHPGEAKAMSGGGCAWSSNELKGDPIAVDDSSRIFSEEVLNELIWSRYDRNQFRKT
ncbi:MAG: radical SAM protein [Candidatus Pacebacteria bacterium]|jgi:radical SAM protein with 4Fe4S-binding SPASM domain|nr:radical SAM protein [Candidatus Paceibacterota bacterium]